ncbi:MAG: sensor histidine kinase [Eubacteriales bacterium]|nr:sensor histidine kinase [Eubacteriales bacterium]
MRRKSHLRDSIFLTSLFTIIGILAVFFPLSYFLTTDLTQDNARDYSRQLLGQIKNSIEFYTEEMIMISGYLADHPDVRVYLEGENPLAPSSYSLYQQRARISSELKAISGTRQDLVNIILFREDGDFITNREHAGLTPYWDYREFDWYQETVAAKGLPRLSSSRVENVIAGEHRWVVSLSRAIYDQDHLLGVLLIDLNFQTIADICSNLSGQNGAYVFIMGANDELVYHPQQRLIYSSVKSERFDLVRRSEAIESVIRDGIIYSSVKIKSADWVIVSVTDTRQMVQVSPLVIVTYIGIGLVFALIALVVSLLASRRLTEPILALKNSMQQFQQGDFNAQAQITATNEIAELGDQFNSMTQQIKTLVEHERLIEEQKRKSEIQALQSQIRPHFLYNTLESIIWMASSGEQDKVVEMTSSLAKLMRASASKAREMVTVQMEIDTVSHYLRIQKLRYQDKLQYEIEIDPEVLLARMLRLSLQPLVENAIYHGIKPLRDGGLLVIRAYRAGSELLVEVADNGVGFAPDALHASLEASMDEGESIGLHNVHNRIQLMFGKEYGVSVRSAGPGQNVLDQSDFDPAAGIRTIVSIRLPLVFE